MDGIDLMSVKKQLEFMINETTARIVDINNLVIAGWTGRNIDAMEAHISELEELGVSRPGKIPSFYRCSVDQLTMEDKFQVIGTDSSGEIEFFILSLSDGYWVGLGSDHTDRVIEASDVTVSKQMCAKPIAKRLWRYEDVVDHWDQLVLKSTIIVDGNEEQYQEGPVTTMRDPQELISLYTSSGVLPLGTLMFCGTLAAVGGVRPADIFQASLIDQKLNRKINFSYEALSLPPEE
jgi:hypothetical protein